jgi:serine/threonine protein kinase
MATKEKVAIKMYRKKLLDYRGTIRAYQEINALMKLNHPNIVRLVTHYDDKEHISLVMEYVEGGDLFDFLTRMKSKHEVRG